MPATQSPPEYTLPLDGEDRAELLRLLEESLMAVHHEAPAYQEQVYRQESFLRRLTEKVRRLGECQSVGPPRRPGSAP